jgi:hypothetical protein
MGLMKPGEIPMENSPVATAPDTDPTQIRLKRAQSLLRRIDKRCWDDLRRRSAKQIANEFRDSSLVPFNFINRFPRHLRPLIKEQVAIAFEQRKSLQYHRDGKRRDLSIETKHCEDGIFRAWFSSEYRGCANGDYYLVISPTQAIYYERD